MTNYYLYLVLNYQNQKCHNAQLMLIVQEMLKSTNKKNQRKYVHSRYSKNIIKVGHSLKEEDFGDVSQDVPSSHLSTRLLLHYIYQKMIKH